MRALPNLSLMVGKQLDLVKKTRADVVSSPEIGDPNITESDVEVQLVRRGKRNRKREEEAKAVAKERIGESPLGGNSEPERENKKTRRDSLAG